MKATLNMLRAPTQRRLEKLTYIALIYIHFTLQPTDRESSEASHSVFLAPPVLVRIPVLVPVLVIIVIVIVLVIIVLLIVMLAIVVRLIIVLLIIVLLIIVFLIIVLLIIVLLIIVVLVTIVLVIVRVYVVMLAVVVLIAVVFILITIVLITVVLITIVVFVVIKRWIRLLWPVGWTPHLTGDMLCRNASLSLRDGVFFLGCAGSTCRSTRFGAGSRTSLARACCSTGCGFS